jgi:large subunit ribosomal protein L25
MKPAFELDAQSRAEAGKGSARALRRDERIPAVIYGKGLKETASISLPKKELSMAFHKGGFFSKLVNIKVGDKVYHTIPRDVQLHPVSDQIEHADFLNVTSESRINVFVPVQFRNVERCAGIKRGGTLNIVRHDLELVTTPDNIPDDIVIDIKEANIGDSIHISMVDLPEGVTPAITDRDFTIATIAGRGGKADKEDEAAEGAEGEGAEEAEATANE